VTDVKKVYWHEHTQEELKELIPKLDVTLIPTGSTEIHGPHLGVGNDILSEPSSSMLYGWVLRHTI
jgi:hypothetical protein